MNAYFLRRLGGVIVEGETQAGIYRAAVPKERIHVVANFAEDCLFASVQAIAAKFAHPKPLRILFLSNLLPGKGHEELVDAFFGLDERTKAGIRIDLAGGFESERQRDTFLARIAGDERIRYHGTVAGERKRTLLARAHVFCLPTYYPYEGQPVSILEAFASGCAVITTDHSGIPDVFRDGTNGFQVAPRSVADLRLAIKRAVLDPDELRRIAATNHETALGRFRTSEFQRAVVQIIDSVARQ
jgi:glycosyltransferase involved in cell wall biosynthesis